MASEGFKFEEFPWWTGEPDRRRLCVAGKDPIRISCTLEGASFADETPPTDELVVMAYNIERGLYAEEQVRALLDDNAIPAPDVVLISEADRFCQRTKFRNVARMWAQGLSMNYVYGVEFIELPRWKSFGGGGPMLRTGEHGNAILSRYPLGNVRLIRHEINRSWYSFWQRIFWIGQPRKGGRMALAADVKVGEKYLRLYSVHFESKGGPTYRPSQAAELADDARTSAQVLIGGDMNCSEYRGDLEIGTARDGVTQALFGQGYADSHAGMAPSDRATSRSGYPIDLLMGKGVTFAGAGIGLAERWDALSDHRPVWARVRLG